MAAPAAPTSVTLTLRQFQSILGGTAQGAGLNVAWTAATDTTINKWQLTAWDGEGDQDYGSDWVVSTDPAARQKFYSAVSGDPLWQFDVTRFVMFAYNADGRSPRSAFVTVDFNTMQPGDSATTPVTTPVTPPAPTNGNGNGAQPPVTVPVPAKPTMVSATYVLTTGETTVYDVTYTWTAPTDDTITQWYYEYGDPQKNIPRIPIYTIPGDAATRTYTIPRHFASTLISRGVAVTAVVRSQNAGGLSDWSDPIALTAGSAPPAPPAPTVSVSPTGAYRGVVRDLSESLTVETGREPWGFTSWVVEGTKRTLALLTDAQAVFDVGGVVTFDSVAYVIQRRETILQGGRAVGYVYQLTAAR